MHSIFYRADPDLYREILIESALIAERVHIDKMEANSWARKFVPGMSAEDAIDIIMDDPRQHFVFIHRQNQEELTMIEGHTSFFEIGSSTMGRTPEYFIFIYLTEKNALKIMKKFKIHKRL
jgi:hypothetical protein